MKKGFTLVSLVLYVALFFAFTVFATAMSTNLNHKILSEKGKIVIQDNYMKLYSNLINSAKKSNSIDVIGTKIIFSNGDIYEYNSSDKEILKNSGNLVSNVDSFTIKKLDEIAGIQNDITNINIAECLGFNISFRKYNEIINRDIVISVGDGLYE